MTTDEVQQTGGRRATRSTDDDEFSSENYVRRFEPPPPDPSDTVILGTVPGELGDADEIAVSTVGALRTDSDAERESEAESESDADMESEDPHPAGAESESEAGMESEDPHPAEVDMGSEHPHPAEAGVATTGDVDEDDVPPGAGAISDEPAGDPADETSSEEAAAAGDATPADIESGSYLEMRQVAGLTAGSMMRLTLGRAFEFNESNEGGSFSLRVLENGEVVVHPGSAHAVLDEVEVDEPMIVGEALLNVSSACFSVRRPRPPASSESRMESIGAAFASISPIAVPALSTEVPLAPDQLTGSRLGTIINRNPLTRGAVGREAWNFLQSIRQTRSVVAERHRLVHPDPEELKTRLSRLDPGLWERSRQHPLFGRFGVGYANIPWEPRFDTPELIPEILHEPIVEMSLLPWVPVTANLLYGPLGIVGKRAARLAACRHAILSLAALSMPGEVQFAVRSGQNTATSWNWARALPAIMSVDDDSTYVVTIIDGADGARVHEATLQAAADDAGSPSDATIPTPDDDPEKVDDTIAADPSPTGEVPVIRPEGSAADGAGDTSDSPEAAVAGQMPMTGYPTSGHPTSGYIVLADSVDELTQPCGTVLQIEADGTGSVTNHLNESIQVTPIGVTEAFAHDMATRIADILTNSFL